eukprot:4933794-Lingulodinium_polyedra.AAC.1
MPRREVVDVAHAPRFLEVQTTGNIHNIAGVVALDAPESLRDDQPQIGDRRGSYAAPGSGLRA